MAKIEDFGEKIGGARKDLWADRGLTASDLMDLTEREAEKYVTKENVWPKPDYDQLIEQGLPYHIAFYQKQVRDKLPAKTYYLTSDKTPELRRARQEQFIETLRSIKEVVEVTSTLEDVYAAFERTLVQQGYYVLNQGRYRLTEKIYSNPHLEQKMATVLQITGERDYIETVMKPAKTAQFDLPPEKRLPAGYQIKLNDNPRNIFSTEKWKVGTFYVMKKSNILRVNLESEQEARTWIEAHARQSKKKKRKRRYTPPFLEKLRRDGPDVRQDRDIAASEYLDVFHFRGGEFGNWMPDTERQAHLNMGFEAFHDLACALDIPLHQISLGGFLGIAFGARGHGKAAAHYESDLQVINLTRMRGSGSLGHEWWHALDDYLGHQLGAGTFLSERPTHYEPFAALLSAIKYKPETEEQAQARILDQLSDDDRRMEQALEIYVERYLKTPEARAAFPALKSAFLSGDVESVEGMSRLTKEDGSGVIPKKQREYMQLLAGRAQYRDTKPHKVSIQRVKTDYYKNSIRMGMICEKDGDYWDSNVELTARAFATYIQDRLNHHSDYLIGHAECAIDFDIDASGELAILKAYPEGEERLRINQAFDSLIADLHQRGVLAQAEPAPGLQML